MNRKVQFLPMSERSLRDSRMNGITEMYVYGICMDITIAFAVSLVPVSSKKDSRQVKLWPGHRD